MMKRIFMFLSVVPLIMGILAMTGTPAFAATFSNNNVTMLNDASACDAVGKADPYPSEIAVSGLGSSVSDVNVTLSGLGYLYPDDLGVLLVGPQGQKTILMEDTGYLGSIQNTELTFDDAALVALPDSPFNAKITSGTYKPTSGSNDGGWEGCLAPSSYPDPAPTGPYDSSLAVFNDTNPNGTWKLYVIDDSPNNYVGSISSWSLDISATGTPSDSTAPSVPTGVSATAVASPVVTWTPSTDSVGVTKYNIKRSTTLDGTYTTVGSVTGTPPTASFTDSTAGPSTTYYYTVNAEDASTNTSADSSASSPITTPGTSDTTAPTVFSTTPGNNGTMTNRANNVTATFSEDVKNVNATTFKLVRLNADGTTTKVTATVSYVDATKKAILNPASNLSSRRTYKATVTTGAQDLAGTALDQNPNIAGNQPKNWKFKVQ
jgi:subtilisin-like proprotein convertase family protein